MKRLQVDTRRGGGGGGRIEQLRAETRQLLSQLLPAAAYEDEEEATGGRRVEEETRRLLSLIRAEEEEEEVEPLVVAAAATTNWSRTVADGVSRFGETVLRNMAMIVVTGAATSVAGPAGAFVAGLAGQKLLDVAGALLTRPRGDDDVAVVANATKVVLTNPEIMAAQNFIAGGAANAVANIAMAALGGGIGGGLFGVGMQAFGSVVKGRALQFVLEKWGAADLIEMGGQRLADIVNNNKLAGKSVFSEKNQKWLRELLASRGYDAKWVEATYGSMLAGLAQGAVRDAAINMVGQVGPRVHQAVNDAAKEAEPGGLSLFLQTARRRAYDVASKAIMAGRGIAESLAQGVAKGLEEYYGVSVTATAATTDVRAAAKLERSERQRQLLDATTELGAKRAAQRLSRTTAVMQSLLDSAVLEAAASATETRVKELIRDVTGGIRFRPIGKAQAEKLVRPLVNLIKEHADVFDDTVIAEMTSQVTNVDMDDLKKWVRGEEGGRLSSVVERVLRSSTMTATRQLTVGQIRSQIARGIGLLETLASDQVETLRVLTHLGVNIGETALKWSGRPDDDVALQAIRMARRTMDSVPSIAQARAELMKQFGIGYGQGAEEEVVLERVLTRAATNWFVGRPGREIAKDVTNDLLWGEGTDWQPARAVTSKTVDIVVDGVVRLADATRTVQEALNAPGVTKAAIHAFGGNAITNPELFPYGPEPRPPPSMLSRAVDEMYRLAYEREPPTQAKPLPQMEPAGSF